MPVRGDAGCAGFTGSNHSCTSKAAAMVVCISAPDQSDKRLSPASAGGEGQPSKTSKQSHCRSFAFCVFAGILAMAIRYLAFLLHLGTACGEGLTGGNRYIILLSRQGKVVSLLSNLWGESFELRYHKQRLCKWFTTLSPKEKAKITKDVSALVLARRTRMCNFLEYKGPPSPTSPPSTTNPLTHI